MAETELDRAQKRYEQARARLQALRNREAARTRKIDTRRKVILGGALMDLATRDSNAAVLLDRLLRNLPREQDRKSFDGWSLEVQGTGGTGDDRSADTDASSAPSGSSGLGSSA